MEILFKDNNWLYIINNNTIECTLFKAIDYSIDLSNVKHLDDVEVLYNMANSKGEVYPVYYTYVENNYPLSVTKRGDTYIIMHFDSSFKKDYTISNLKLL